MAQDLGKPTDRELAAGPKVNRGCTDILCLLLFIAFAVVCGGIAVYAVQNGDPQKLTIPFDPDHRPCGEGELADYPYIYFVNPQPDSLYQTTCVKSCPKENDSSLQCATNSVVTSCKKNLSPTSSNGRVIIYDTVPYAGKICMPEVQSYLDKISSALNIDQVNNAISDIRNTWMMITGSSLIAIIMGFIFLKIVRFSAGCVVWSSILIFISGLLLAAFRCYIEYQKKLASQDSDNSNQKVEGSTSLGAEEFKYLAIIFASLAGIAVLVTFCMCSRIRLCVAVIKCSARFVSDVSSTLFVPVVFFLITLAYISYWVVIASYLFSCGTVSDKPKQLPFGQFQYNQELKNFGYAHGFQLLWVNAFLVASCQFIIIGACAYWYYQRGGGSEISKSVGLYLKNHIGSVAFGSIIIAIIQVIRIILQYVEDQVKQAGGDNNQMVTMIIKCCECYLSCFERFIKFLNKNAYIQIVMTGNSFCTASKDAFTLLLRNPARISLVSGFGSIFEFLGNVAIMASTTILCYVALTNTEYYQSRISSPIFPCVCIGIISYSVGNFFMQLFGTAADCIIVLFCMDEEMHTQAKFQPEELRDFIDEHDKEHN